MKKPAIEGGNPIRKNFLVFGKPAIGKEEIEEVVKTLKSGWIGTGPKTKKFEESFRGYIGGKYAVAVNSCTAALHLTLLTAGVGCKDEVITSPMTFASTVNVIEHVGARPVFVDIEKDSLNIDAKKIEEKITSKTKLILPIHIGGTPCRIREILSLAKKYKLFVLFDAAHAIETEYEGKNVGTFGDASAYSFYPTKNLTTIEGGMVITKRKSWADKILLMSNHGISKDAWKRYTSYGFVPYETIVPGFKYNMTDVQASVGIWQLKKLKKNWRLRKKICQLYSGAFLKHDLVKLFDEPENGQSAYQLFVIKLELEKLKISRNQFIDALKAENIGTGIHFISLHLHRYYKEKYGFKERDYPVAWNTSQRIVSLPLSNSMKTQDAQETIEAVNKILNYYRK
jgi:dTDP-4-amino-4,6-dideoxygalactose transaminase